jgi:hypothetical protein
MVLMSRHRYAWTTILWLIAVIGKMKFNGLVYGFDYGLFQPDGARYSFQALQIIGTPKIDAAQKVAEWYQSHSFKLRDLDYRIIIDSESPGYALVKTRVIYPLLSAPFVLAFGLWGMLVVPILSLLVLLLVNQYLAEKNNAPYVGLFISILLISSPTVMRWMMVNTTDSLLTGFFAIVVLVLVALQKRSEPGMLSGFLIAGVVITSFTRFCLPIWLAVGLYFFVVKRARLALVITVAALLASLPALLTSAEHAQNVSAKDSSVLTQAMHFPLTAFKVLFIEIAQLLVLDKILLLLIGLSAAVALTNLRKSSAFLFVFVFFAVWLIGSINGTLGVNFRYQLPLLPFMLWNLYANIPRRIDLGENV